jgi:non-canonical poly(A) RNA polymerase PAPD5/7
LYAILKTALDMRGLNDVFRGGLGSYSLFMLIRMASEKAREYAVANATAPPSEADLARSDLMEFLRFYGTFLDTYGYGITVDPPRIFKKLLEYTPKPNDHPVSLIP